MDLWKIILVTMLASGFVVVASFQIGHDLNQQDGEYGPASNQCGFCHYYFQTGHSPYEILWKLGSEIRSHMSLKSQALTLMDMGHLKIAEYFFHDYCHKTCGKKEKEFRRGYSVDLPCQNEGENIDYE